MYLKKLFQLIKKTNSIKNVLLNYGERLKRSNKNLVGWLRKQRDANHGLPCQYLEIQSLKDDLEKCVGYRNKCEFSIGKIYNK